VHGFGSLGAEIFGATSDRVGGQGQVRFNLGSIMDVSERHHLLLSAGRSLSGDAVYQMYAGYQLTI
jgi:hypothetical protein